MFIRISLPYNEEFVHFVEIRYTSDYCIQLLLVETDIPESPLGELSRSGWPPLHPSPLCRGIQPSGGGGVFTTARGRRPRQGQGVSHRSHT